MTNRPHKYIKHRIANCAAALGCSCTAVYAAIKKRGEKDIARRLRELAKIKPADAHALEELAAKFEGRP